MRELAFYFVGAGAIVFSLGMLVQRSLYAAAVCLLMALLQTAVMLSLAGSPLVGCIQLIVSAGGVMVLVVVAIMAAPSQAKAMWARFAVPKPLAAAGVLVLAAELLALITLPGLSGGVPPAGALDAKVGAVLFGSYAVATEAAALVLFLAALAVVGQEENDFMKRRGVSPHGCFPLAACGTRPGRGGGK
ncbi:MAG: NADH-quinone oxidoreductase subunit J [Elusimicrobia bacterium]|nr:NADH-quinone oxidoreductase subunit J [Elusimicrobiota bacterium]